jgi:hypothetical protein
MKTTQVTPYSALPDSTVQAADGISYAYRDTGGEEESVPLVLLQHFRGNLDYWDPALVDALAVQQARRGSGTLVLSEFTGAADELREALPCNPFDVEGLSQPIELALRLPGDARRAALAAMARHVRGHDVHQWVAGQLAGIACRGTAP